MKDNLLVEVGTGFEVEMRNEDPEVDEGGRKRIKQRKKTWLERHRCAIDGF
jgi:hypothetical protein